MKPKLVPFMIILVTALCAAQLFLLSTPNSVTALPPRPTPTAVPSLNSQIPGAQIMLHVENIVSQNIWTIVQWQDAHNDWHDVAGWQGTLDSNNSKTWWVGEEDLDTGPFRWLVVEDNQILGISDSFYLPLHPYDTLIINTSLNMP
jgi:hypothetical protein